MNQKYRPNIKIIALGHKARQGKDVCAEYMCSRLKGARIYHWADALKKEVEFNDTIKLIRRGDTVEFNDTQMGKGFHVPVMSIQTQKTIIDWCNKNDISPDGGVYYGSKEKDSILLQFWGTDYRRNNFGQDYWVNRTMEAIYADWLVDNSIKYAIIPDTRFKNEYAAARFMGGTYIEVQRYDVTSIIPDEITYTRYIDPERDPFHPSECELDDVAQDFLITAKTGDIQSLYMQVDYIISQIRIREHSVRAIHETIHY